MRTRGDTIFDPEVQHHKGAYVSVEESTNDWISLDPFTSPNRSQRPSFGCPISILTKKRAIQTFWGVTTTLELPDGT
jgi:hypothetical protein